MTRARWSRVAVWAVLALLLLVVGAELRPLFVADPAAASTEGPSPEVLSPTEIGFAQDMAAHHQQAIVMVQRLDPAVDPTVYRLALQIGDAQRFEIGTMLGWLRLAGAPTTNPSPMSWMESHHVAGVEMPQAADRQLTAGAVKQTAREMIQAQSQEAGQMTLMLGQLGAPPLS